MRKLKYILSFILCITLFCSTSPIALAMDDSAEPVEAELTETMALQINADASVGYAQVDIKVDFNKDGVVTSDDAQLLLKIAAGQADIVEEADINGDGVISIDDVSSFISQGFTSMTDEEYVEYLLDAGFTRSYTDALLALYKKYPEWEFVPFITNLTWSEAVEGEHTPHNKQLIENIVSADFMCACSSCKGVIQEASNWVSASESAVEYYLDPRNFLNEQGIFQFETTAYEETHTIQAVESILKPTWMYNSEISYLDASGATKTYLKNGAPVKYSQAIMEAAKASGMSAYFLASKIVQEVGSSKASYAGGSCGNSAPYNGIYNYYNIGAYTGAGDGLRWANAYMKAKIETPMYSSASTTASKVTTVAKNTELNFIEISGGFYKVSATVSGKKYSGFIPKVNISASTTYGRPWDNPYKSIYYGAQYIYESFSEYQFTGYLQKFNVNPNSDNLYGHEYMANIRAAEAESKKTYKAYNESGVLATKKVFSIPVFKDMPNANQSAEEAFKSEKPIVSATASETSVTLSWKSIKNALYYQIWKFDESSKSYKMIKATSAISYTDTGFSGGSSAKYKIRAFNRDANNEYVFTQYSDEFIARSAPAMPTGLMVDTVNDTSVKLKWNTVPCDGYNVYRYNSVSGYALAGTVTEAQFYDTSLSSGARYMYKICAFYKSASMVAYSSQTSTLTVKTTGAAQLTGTVNVNDSLNIRKENSTSSDIVTTAQNGQVLLILETLDGWYKVQFAVNGNTYTGYASADYIKLNVVETTEACQYTEPTVNLKQGSSGEGVKWLQWHLYKAGYMEEKEIDGAFGAQTTLVVKTYQQDKGLTADGVVGAGTRAELKKLN